MTALLEDILAPNGSIARRLGGRYEFRPQQLAMDYAVKHKKRVVVSTHTISLQEQLIEKDIPLIQSVYPDEFTAVLVKGRGNYLCQRRLEQTRQRQNALFEDQRQLE